MTRSPQKVYLCFDYGTKRIGVAKSDPLGLIASPVATLSVSSRANALKQVRSMIHELRPDGLVFGYPLLESGDKSLKCIEIDRFIDEISNYFKGPIHRADESYTSVDAMDVFRAFGKRVKGKKGHIDRIAAVIILQRFLDEQVRL